MTQKKKVLLAVGGGIAAYKAAELVRELGRRGHSVRVALSRSAEAFVAPLTLEVLTGAPVYRQEYLSANGSGEELHITAAQWADAVCVAPATAHLLARLSLGLADDFITTTALAFSGPILAAPAMHSTMWGQPAIQGHVKTLRGRGLRIVGPEEGPLASGEVGMGRMAAPATIADALEEVWSPGDLASWSFLITAGPTREPIDPVRYLGNRSSGKMGFALAAEAAARGARVLLVAGPVHLPTPAGVERVDVGTALEMEAAVKARVGTADAVIMTAAVADFRPREISQEKIKKGLAVPVVELVRNPDILLGLREVAPGALRMGFAAETEQVEHHAREKLERKGAHFIVANDVARSDIGFRSEENEVTVYRRHGDPIFLSRRPKRQVAVALLNLCRDHLKHHHEQLATSIAGP